MNAKHKEPSDVDQFVTAVCKHRSWHRNPDSDFTQLIVNGLSTNYNRFGFFQCPCRDGDGDRKADSDIVCPCAYAQADIDEHGQCFCCLFVSESRLEELRIGDSPKDIPERRPVEKQDQ